MANKRSDIAKLVSAARKVWRESETYKEVKKAAKVPGRTGWYRCASCKCEFEVIRIDHISPIGAQPTTLLLFGAWLENLFCERNNLQPLCNSDHKAKTALERKENARLRKLRKGTEG